MTTKDEERAARLRAALRDNLKRRKSQARGRAEPPPRAAGTPDDDAADRETPRTPTTGA